MKDIFVKGDKKIYDFIVGKSDIAEFESGVVHEVCSTFKLGQAMEWSSRLFVLEMKEPDEEGIGTLLEIKHLGPAFVGDKVELIAIFDELNKNEVLCDIVVSSNGRKVAEGRTGQKIIKKEKIEHIFNQLRGGK